MTTRLFEQPVCKECGGSRLLFDAYAKWDFGAQEYSITAVLDKPIICEDCDLEVKAVWRQVVPPG